MPYAPNWGQQERERERERFLPIISYNICSYYNKVISDITLTFRIAAMFVIFNIQIKVSFNIFIHVYGTFLRQKFTLIVIIVVYLFLLNKNLKYRLHEKCI
jgi:hypothetical protein